MVFSGPFLAEVLSGHTLSLKISVFAFYKELTKFYWKGGNGILLEDLEKSESELHYSIIFSIPFVERCLKNSIFNIPASKFDPNESSSHVSKQSIFFHVISLPRETGMGSESFWSDTIIGNKSAGDL